MMQKVPLVPMAVALMVGIAVSHASVMPVWVWLALLGISAVTGGFILIFSSKSLQSVLFLLLTLTFVAIGALRCLPETPKYNNSHWEHVVSISQKEQPGAVFMTVRLTEPPTPRKKSWRVMTEVEQVENQPTNGSLQLYLRQDSIAATLRYGDHLLAHCHVDLERDMQYITSDHYIITQRDSTSIRAHSEALRAKLTQRMDQGPLENRYSGIAKALALGWRGGLEPNLQTQFSDTGLSHLLCVSGLHVGLLAAMIGGLFFWLGEKRRGRIIRGIIQLITVWCFAGLTGLAPATVRAALMFSFFIVNRMMGRRTDSLNILALAAIVMLMSEPLLIYNIGWQMSFSAVAGILISRPLINLKHNFIWQITIVSITATLATLPITLNIFHKISLYFLIGNIVIVPLAGIMLTVSLLYMAIPCEVTAFLAKWPLLFCDRITNNISHLPGAVINGIEISPLGTVLLVAGIFLLLITINSLLQRYKERKNLPLC